MEFMRRERSPSGPARMAVAALRFSRRSADFQAAALILCVVLTAGLATRAVTIALVLLKKICLSQILIARSQRARTSMSGSARSNV